MFGSILTVTPFLLCLLGVLAAPAVYAEPMSINEGSIPGAAARTVQVDQLAGQFTERFTEDSTHGTFASTAVFTGLQWQLGALVPSTQLNGAAGPGYSIYAKFSATGTSATGTLGFTLPSWTATAGTIEIWADPNQDTVYAAPGTTTGRIGDLVLTSAAASTSDDLLLASSSLLASGSGRSGFRLDPGFSDLTFGSFALSPTGASYFGLPTSNALGLDLKGFFVGTLTSPVGGTSSGVNEYLVSTSTVLTTTAPVPEPASWALMAAGVGVGALVVGRRRRASSALPK